MSDRFDIIKTPLQGLQLIQRVPLGDSRGYLERMFCQSDFAELLQEQTIAQVNHTLTEITGTVRGLHFQHPPYAETKFVMCLKGEVYDIAVDVRADSSTFLQWHGEILSAANHKTLLIPEGFAHGFQTLTEDCEMLYFHTAPYHSNSEAALNALDPKLAIAWPLQVTEQSTRDKQHPMINPDFHGVAL
ncbi:dTDP-4-dehydrorhamnose 3,5-epimerase family protein [Chlorobium sp. KB01]|uniref:dTDP-4-dehydrorhamnose 3,5-epimerase family protein n=1 Tax=Chlorobium sp. KB01 TaxID=1917528 RepID=UPI00097562C6|nr:dTDP-4-dehydrorhamnose 3,5-epimerase family protein [Chlorobium sp. KB01]